MINAAGMHPQNALYVGTGQQAMMIAKCSCNAPQQQARRDETQIGLIGIACDAKKVGRRQDTCDDAKVLSRGHEGQVWLGKKGKKVSESHISEEDGSQTAKRKRKTSALKDLYQRGSRLTLQSSRKGTCMSWVTEAYLELSLALTAYVPDLPREASSRTTLYVSLKRVVAAMSVWANDHAAHLHEAARPCDVTIGDRG